MHIKTARRSAGILADMTTTTSYAALTRGISRQLSALRGDLPAVMKSFNDLSKASLSDGALTEKTKELIALALGVAAHCDGCLGFHAKALARLGATRAEVEEALAVAVYMGGGPSLMYSANAMKAFAEFAQQTTEIRT
jgi:AhpD family alkylhydroperoxidase